MEFINVPKTDASTFTMAIKDCLVQFGLPIIQCRGQAYNGASNMSGHVSGVASQIHKLEPSAIYVHCLAHCTNLCLQTVGRQVAPVRDALDLHVCNDGREPTHSVFTKEVNIISVYAG